MIKTVILTISDTRIPDNDTSGQALREMLPKEDYSIVVYKIVKDDKGEIEKLLIEFADKVRADLVLTTGGTGLSPRDVTPEATAAVIGKAIPGLAEYIKMTGAQKTKKALLSRGLAGVRGTTLILNLPGSTKGVRESLECVLEVIPHAVDMIRGKGH